MNKAKRIILAIGLLFIIISGLTAYNKYTFLQSAVKTIGVITDYRIEIKEENSGKRKKQTRYYYPIFEFKDNQNRLIQEKSNVGTGGSMPYPVGHKIEIVYEKENPQNASINDFSSNWFLTLILGAFSIVFFLIGFFIPKNK